ncbi:ABC transporter [Streptomyces viridiviolaceus]|uniref:ABC transporter n=1 Tax=Streptomyces viridiviolaceus TaxID=68282 RepID=UPI001E2E09E1|nr:ABC transporter [Streptomyces viridiviolaceus]
MRRVTGEHGKGTAGRGVVWALVRPVWRTLPWRALGAAGTVGLLLAGTSRLVSGGPTPWLTLVLLRAAALVGALGLAFLLDDPARHLTAPVPTRRPLRQALRAVLVAPPVALWWAAVLLLAPAKVRPPVAGVTVEAAATCALAFAGAAAAVRLTREQRPGQAVAAALLTSAVLAPLLLPDGWELFVPAENPAWDAAHDRWALVSVAAVVAWGLCGPEPSARWARVRGPGGRRAGSSA